MTGGVSSLSSRAKDEGGIVACPFRAPGNEEARVAVVRVPYCSPGNARIHIAAHYHRAPVRARVFAFHDILGARRVHVDRGCGGTRDVGFGDEHSRRTRGREWDERSRWRGDASTNSAGNSVNLDAKAPSGGLEVVLAFGA